MASTQTATDGKVVRSEDGTEIFVKQFVADSPKAQVLVCHGYLEHCLRYREFGEYMAGRGISFTTFDFRGHGKSGGKRAYLDDWAKYGADYDAALSTLRPYDEVPTFIMGHSCGGLVVLDRHLTAASSGSFPEGVRGIVLSSPYIRPAEDLPYIKVLLSRAFGKVYPSLSIPANLKGEDLTSDPEKQREHRDDPDNLGSATAGWAKQCMEAQERVRAALDGGTASLPVPVLFSYGTADVVANPETNREASESLKSEDKTVLRREGEMHEPLNEVKRQELFQLIAEWILERA